jgi:hypothetical protein
MELKNFKIEKKSWVETSGSTYTIVRNANGKKFLAVAGNTSGFDGTAQEGEFLICPLTPANAATLRLRLPWLNPVPLGLKTTAGFGDRLGLATPGHIWAIRNYPTIAPIFAQQSVRENTRTGRTPQQVMDDALWGVFGEGWREPWGADADHLKIPEVVDDFVAAGYTFFTVDPGDHVDNDAHTAPVAEIETKVQALPWDKLHDTAAAIEQRYLSQPFDLGDITITFNLITLRRAAAKYGQAIAHAAQMYHYLAGKMQGKKFDFEVSVDETETPTSPEEHYFIAAELRRLGVQWVSLAPRFIGKFEKGVDYIGDLDALEIELEKHAAITRALGPYKLSIHSGSDKFSVYPVIARLTDGLVHLKTAGTSYLEALRTVALANPALFRQILDFSRERYETDRATYHVSGQLAKVPAADSLSDADLPNLLNQFDARQVLHVTFGSVLDQFGGQLATVLENNQETYGKLLEAHFKRHLIPFVER